MQSSALLEWTHDVSKIGTFGLIKFVFSSTQDISYRVLRGKTSNFDFFFFQKRPSWWAHIKNSNDFFKKKLKWDFAEKGWRWQEDRQAESPCLATVLTRTPALLPAILPWHFRPLISKTRCYDGTLIYKNQFSPLICEQRKWGEWAWNLLIIRPMVRGWGRIDTLQL